MFPRQVEDGSGESFEIRELQPADREALAAFYADFEPKRAAQGLPPEDEAARARWLGEILAGGDHLIALHEGRLVGHAFLVPASHAAHTAEYAIFLERAVRGRGLGSRLNELAVQLARDAGYTALWLSVEPHNRAAIRSYQKVGFRFLPHTVYGSEAEMRLEL